PVTAMPAGSYSAATLERHPELNGNEQRPTWRGVQQRTRACRSHRNANTVWSADSFARDTSLSVMYSEGVKFRVLLPCDTKDLVTSALLPPSIYGKDEVLFTESEFRALERDVQGALAIDRQAEWSPQKWAWHLGLQDGVARYNRVEGLSIGAKADRVMGNGYRWIGSARLGVADLQPNAEAT